MFARPRLLRQKLVHRAFHDLRPYQEDSRWPGWQVIVGIETHAQLKSRRKLFSEGLIGNLEDAPNTHVASFDAAYPGTLPKINPKCVDLALRTAIALNCKISPRSSFDRKHYFYSDLPSGYQITQQYSPLASNGELWIGMSNSSRFSVRIKQIQLEQDTAKSTFNSHTFTSRIDLNRAGVGLMEIVSEPDIRSPEEAGAYVRTLQAVLRSMGSSDGNMEQGSMRCDVNVSVNRKGDPPGTRCELKNLNSVRFMMAAISHEVKRQSEYLLANPGKSVPQETRGFNEDTFETFRMRSKEDAPDYRYMPDSNLGILALSQATKGKSLDVLLNVDNGREIGFDGEGGSGAVEYFERLCQSADGGTQGRNPGVVLNWLTHELLGQLSARKETFSDNSLSTTQFGELIDLVQNKSITGTSGKFLLKHLLAHPSSRSTKEVAADLQLLALASSPPSSSGSQTNLTSIGSELQLLCESAVAELPSEVAAVRAGNKNVLNKIVGHVMKKSRGRADATAARQLVEQLILGDSQ
ncbi:hypothetical protein D9619_000691 [Psilocybe cf. subviscida]|uniref:Glutamyl-tRNA(Gln) amidotransferase subunit B, mitochondrial n=1 Tax=Psilocybe cf. subviscida TaxID=2480587 RepID=A0A8H5BEX4_9AGAR|nr:hypothetical protein D9619_000691 [Psilocybe cf. subviscida]